MSEGRGRLRHSRPPVERPDSGPETAQPPRNSSHHGIRRRARRREYRMGAARRRHHQSRALDPRPAARHRPLEAVVGNLLLSIRPPHQRKPRRPRHPQGTGGSRTDPTTRVTSLSAKTPRAFEPIPESSPDSGASRTISCDAINRTQSPKTASPLLSEASNQYLQ
jgi:hypothetical protein